MDLIVSAIREDKTIAKQKKIKDRWNMAYRYALAKNCSCELSEDFAQTYTMNVAVFKRYQPLKYALVDFYRKYFGDTRHKKHQVNTIFSIDDRLPPLTPAELYEIKETRDQNLASLKPRSREIMRRLKTQTQKEICYDLGITQPCISQLIARLSKRFVDLD